jgi:hypothetical protein
MRRRNKQKNKNCYFGIEEKNLFSSGGLKSSKGRTCDGENEI